MSEGTTKCPAGIPAWVMTFADLMSLLLAFFVLMFSFSEMDKNVYKELAGSLKEAFGVQREVKVMDPPKGINIIAREFSPGKPTPTPTDEVHQLTTDDYHMHPVFTDPTDEGQENSGKKDKDDKNESYNASVDELETAADSKTIPAVADVSQNKMDQGKVDPVKDHSEAIRKALSNEIMNGLIDLDVKEKRIILRVRERGSFPSGSADMMLPFKNIINRIGQVFGDFKGTIIVSGHTDNLPIHTDRFRSNWELSSSRAVSVLHELSKDSHLMKKRFQIAAYADTQPIDTNTTPAGRAKNRRVEIMLDYTDSPDDTRDAEPLKTDADTSKSGMRTSNPSASSSQGDNRGGSVEVAD
jgi:chemotaxis protein MotB